MDIQKTGGVTGLLISNKSHFRFKLRLGFARLRRLSYHGTSKYVYALLRLDFEPLTVVKWSPLARCTLK